MRGLQTGKGDKLCQKRISSSTSRTCGHTRVEEVGFTWAESETVDASWERYQEAASPSETAKSLSGLEKTGWSFDWRAPPIPALPHGEHLLCTSEGSRRQQCQLCPSENITVQRNVQLKWKGNQSQPLRVYWLLWVVNMSQIIRKKGKFSQKKPLHSDLIPIHSFDAEEEISISLLCTLFVRFCSPLIM